MSAKRTMHSWGRVSPVVTEVRSPAWRSEICPSGGAGSGASDGALPTPTLAYGLGRSYGDSCLLGSGTMIETRFLDRIIAFDEKTGLLRAEAGISLNDILSFAVPRGWFLPTTPGTRYVTLGGAIANDVHGKNHHKAGCFGNHVPSFELLRSDGSRQVCSAGDAMHSATVGGLGLTGMITWAELQLVPIRSAMLDVEYVRFDGVEEFLTLSEESGKDWEHTVAWFDCLAVGSSLGRGIFMRGNWCEGSEGSDGESSSDELKPHQAPRLAIPIDFPEIALNQLSVKLFNFAYYHKMMGKRRTLRQHYSPFFHPLDAVNGWSRIYGRRGFFQYQSVTPFEAGAEPIEEMLKCIARSGQGSFLGVLKTFGDVPSPGMLSFPAPGVTLALDFANQGGLTRLLFDELDEIVRQAKGRLYPAKDARMSREDFERFYPRLDEFRKHVDAGFSSEFWQRMNS